jgi:hypothetical protein
LVDALENFGLAQPSDVATTLNNVFVTKHEVLMLRRTMGDKRRELPSRLMYHSK